MKLVMEADVTGCTVIVISAVVMEVDVTGCAVIVIKQISDES